MKNMTYRQLGALILLMSDAQKAACIKVESAGEFGTDVFLGSLQITGPNNSLGDNVPVISIDPIKDRQPDFSDGFDIGDIANSIGLDYNNTESMCYRDLGENIMMMNDEDIMSNVTIEVDDEMYGQIQFKHADDHCDVEDGHPYLSL